MDSVQFYEEVINSDLCPDNFDEIYKDFQRYQKLVANTLSAFHQVCEKNGLRYQLGFGSLLGAIRDNGQIPWDYDIDVIIPYEERFKLVEALHKDLPKDYYFYCPEVNEDCRHCGMRVTPKGYRSDKLHVDVFYVIGVPEEEKKRTLFVGYLTDCYEKRFIRKLKLGDFVSVKRRIKFLFKKARIINLSTNEINNKLEQACIMYDPKETNTSFPLQQVYKNIHWKTDELWDTELIRTDIGTFRIPRNYDMVLKSIYKDYTVIYPLKNRLAELLGSYGSIVQNPHIYKHGMHKKGRYYLEK